MPHKFISATGTVDIHAAMEAGILPKDLASAKLDWNVANLGDDSKEFLDRLVAYSKRADHADAETVKAPLGTERHRGYSYRCQYYVELTRLTRDDLSVVMDRGFSNM